MIPDPHIVPLGAIDPLAGQGTVKRPAPSSPADPAAFKAALGEASRASGLSFSRHAMQRIERRELSPSADQLARLGAGADLASSKGSRSAAVLVDDLAFVVAVPSRTVVTAIDRSRMQQNVFTNIDTAVIA